MREKYFSYKTLEELRLEVEALGVDITFEEKLDAISRPVDIAGRKIGNSLAIQPMEGCDGMPDGRPGELTYRRWERFGDGGAKLIWGEATAVVPEGRANPRQLMLNKGTMRDIERLLNGTRTKHREAFDRVDDLLVGIQLTHSGRHSYPKPLIAYHHPQVDSVTFADKSRGIKMTRDYPLVSDDYLEKLEDIYVEAVKMAADIGFDFVDIKQCHTYLLNELLGARNRPGKYGGSFENRTRFIRNVLAKVKDRVGNRIIVASRINAFDGVPFFKDPETGVGTPFDYDTPYEYSFGVEKRNPLHEDLTEVIAFVRLLVESGVQLLNVSLGSPYYNMHLGRPFERPPVDGYYTPEHPLIGVERHFRITGQIQDAFPSLPVVGTGYSWLQKFFINAAESNLRRGRVRIIGVGRGAIAYPTFARDVLNGVDLKSSKVCYGVSFCTDLMRSKNNDLGQFPTGCVPRDPVYTKIYKESLVNHKEEQAFEEAKADGEKTK